MELLFDWISAEMLAEYEVNTNNEVKNSTKITTLVDCKFDFKYDPKKRLNIYIINVQ